MTKASILAWPVLAMLAVVLVFGCGPTKTDNTNNPPPPGPPGQPPPGDTGAPGGIKQVMKRFGGPQGLPAKIGGELTANPPSWDDLLKDTTDLKAQAAVLETATPAKGTKDSWVKHVKDFADLAAALDDAIQAKDQAKAKDAQAKLGRGDMRSPACSDCHKDHKGGPGGPPPGPRPPG
jgi:hypothetical protein